MRKPQVDGGRGWVSESMFPRDIGIVLKVLARKARFLDC